MNENNIKLLPSVKRFYLRHLKKQMIRLFNTLEHAGSPLRELLVLAIPGDKDRDDDRMSIRINGVRVNLNRTKRSDCCINCERDCESLEYEKYSKN